MSIQRPEHGSIFDGEIRYVLMRPDVLMGAGRHLADAGGDFLAALEISAFTYAQASFASYQAGQRFGRENFLSSTAAIAGQLGWGLWSHAASEDGATIVTVEGSPFAAGYGRSDRPVCAPITGVLRAMASVGYGAEPVVKEEACAAQGHERCVFRLTGSPLAES